MGFLYWAHLDGCAISSSGRTTTQGNRFHSLAHVLLMDHSSCVIEALHDRPARPRHHGDNIDIFEGDSDDI